MTSRTYATLDPNALGDGLALDLGNLVVSTDIDAASVLDTSGAAGASAVFGTIPKAVGHTYVEVYAYSTSRGDLSGLFRFGVAEVGSSLDVHVGDEPTSWAWDPFGSGAGIWNDGIPITGSADPIATARPERKCMGMYVNWNGVDSSGSPFLAFYDEGSQIGSVVLPSGKFWVFALSLGFSTAGDLSAFVNFGQRVFENQPAPVTT